MGKAVDKMERSEETWQSSTPTEAHLSYVELQSKNIQQSLGVLIKENKWKKEAETHIFNLLLPAAEMRLHRNQKKLTLRKYDVGNLGLERSRGEGSISFFSLEDISRGSVWLEVDDSLRFTCIH